MRSKCKVFAHLSNQVPESHFPLFCPQISSPRLFLKYPSKAWMREAARERGRCGLSPDRAAEEVRWNQAGEGLGKELIPIAGSWVSFGSRREVAG